MAEENIAETEVVESPSIVPSESENEARRMGWVGKEEFKGDPNKWRPADEWLDRGKRILPIVLKENERLQRNLDRVKDQLSEMRDSTKELLEFHKKSEERAYERARKEIEAKIEAAAANADAGTVRAEMVKLDNLAKEHQPKAEPKKNEGNEVTEGRLDPVIQDWIRAEEWFQKDKTLNAFAVEAYGNLERDKPGVSKAELLAETKRRTMEKFPEKFGINPERANARTVAEPSSGNAGRKRGRTFDDLPPEAKAACNKFVKTIPGFKREQYLADYDWEG